MTHTFADRIAAMNAMYRLAAYDILRAAHPSELDYSSSPHQSRLMKEFLLKLFTRHGHAYGAAALEFAAALAAGRLRLAANHRQELRDKTIQLLAGASSPLLGFICLME